MSDLTDPADPDVIAALERKCGICQAQPRSWCTNPCGGGPLPGRLVHHQRIPIPTKRR